MSEMKKVIHYVNQFFGGKGGEEQANLPVEVVEGAVGPGTPLQNALGGDGEIVATLICGDNYFNEEPEAARDGVEDALKRFKPDLVIAGPAFNAGRYGLACGAVCKIVQQHGIPSVTAMYPENPGVLEHRLDVYILPTEDNPIGIAEIVSRLAAFGLKLANGEAIGPAYEEGYLPRGIRKMAEAAEPTYKRAVDMLVAKVNNRPFKSEIPILVPDKVPPAPALNDTSSALIGMVTTGGLIPKGNPERQVSGNPERYFKYSIEGLSQMESKDWEAYHGGYYNITSTENPNYILPLRAMRVLEDTGEVGRIHPWIFTMPGVGTPIEKARRFGREIAQELVDAKIDGCVLVAT